IYSDFGYGGWWWERWERWIGPATGETVPPEWCQLYSSGLTRMKRAFFDEVNVLETYQPRARTMGHLFMHYANEYQHLTKVNREMDAMDKQGNSTDGEPNAAADQESSPKIEGPILIEFQSEPEEDDDDDKNDFHL
ncbi:unnamed protein product, partial [Toxocara canis]|uniref:ARID domain-containing protein n=1 Tax=Toxocara canis TaxID=6265 RepID=A0A183VB09_TOXCA